LTTATWVRLMVQTGTRLGPVGRGQLEEQVIESNNGFEPLVLVKPRTIHRDTATPERLSRNWQCRFSALSTISRTGLPRIGRMQKTEVQGACLNPRNKDVHKSGSLCRGTLQQFSQIVDINSARVTDHKIAEAAMTPSFHIER